MAQPDFQFAEGDLVAARQWIMDVPPETRGTVSFVGGGVIYVVFPGYYNDFPVACSEDEIYFV